MKFLFALFLFGVVVMTCLVTVLFEEGNMKYSDRLEGIQNHDCVAVIHGLGMPTMHTALLARSLEKEGYRVVNVEYPSKEDTMQNLARHHVRPQLPQCEGKLHFVGHSMGGIIIRELLNQDVPDNVGKIVMLGTPNHGSEIVDFNLETPVFKEVFSAFFGPAAMQLRTKDNDYLKQLPAPVVPTGIIAGKNFIEPVGGYLLLPSPNDGKVSVKSTKLKTMTDHIVLEDSHFWLPISHEARMQTMHFLKHGKFK